MTEELPPSGSLAHASQLINESPGGDFTNFFLYAKPYSLCAELTWPSAYPSGQSNKVKSQEDKKKYQADREGVLELCWNWGTGG